LADLVVVNTCSVREKAVQKLRSELGRLARLKRSRPQLTLVVAGCIAQEQGEQLLRRWPNVDLVVGPDNLTQLPELIRQVEAGGSPQAHTAFDLDAPRFLAARQPSESKRPTALVTVAKGCNEGCTYCIVPYTRGPERHRPAPEILHEIEGLVQAGVREVTLLGQTVNGYRDPAGEMCDFAALLRAISKRAPGLARLRYTSAHPRLVSAELIEVHRDLPQLCHHLHLPVQSGSDRILKRMVRRHTAAEYMARVAQLRDRVPGVSLSTDIIVGFPSESREDFNRTLALIRAVGFAGLYAFKYSPRPHTAAVRWQNDVSEPEKSERLAELLEVSESLLGQHLRSLIGGTEQVLVEGPTEPGLYQGRTHHNEIVHFGCSDDPTGELVEVSITSAFKHSLAGNLIDGERARPLARSSQSL
ncbi:tRNA (N6-isopentenyl adenosine(37)-C2)-methylthiotransferase MiaB, partial [Myxococcota bacterium]